MTLFESPGSHGMVEAAFLCLVLLAAVVVLERAVHQRLQVLFWQITGNAELATLLYSLVLLPGVFLHELSHALMARALGVRVRSFSLRPRRLRRNVIQLGYVEVQRSDALRTSLIGAAPLLFGLGALTAIGLLAFDLSAMRAALAENQLDLVGAWLAALPSRADAALWLYLTFAIANSMSPSEADTRTLPAMLFWVALVVGAIVLLSGGAVLSAAAPFVTRAAQWLAAVFLLVAALNLVAAAALSVAIRLVAATTGRTVELQR